MSGSGTQFDSLVNVLQLMLRMMATTQQTLAGGVAVLPGPTVYTVASLPAHAGSGTPAFASNGRKPGEAAGAGTGVPVFFNAATSQWFSVLSGAVVTA
jgi:hypothetical protein